MERLDDRTTRYDRTAGDRPSLPTLFLAHIFIIFRAPFLPPKQNSTQATTGLISVALACCNLALLERKGHATIRSANFYRTTFVAILSLMIPAVICLPLFVAGKKSFVEAEVRALPPCQNCSLDSAPFISSLNIDSSFP